MSLSKSSHIEPITDCSDDDDDRNMGDDEDVMNATFQAPILNQILLTLQGLVSQQSDMVTRQ